MAILGQKDQVRINLWGRVSHRILRLPLIFLVVASAGVVSRAQEQSDRGTLAESVRLFNQDLDRALLSSPASVSGILAERGAKLSQLMQSDPQSAIRLSMSAAQAARSSLVSPDARGLIESQGEWQGTLTVLIDDDFSHGTSRTRYWMETGGENVEVYLADHPADLTSGQAVSVRGIRLEKRIAATLTSVSPSPVLTPACGPMGEQKTAVLLLEFPDVPFPYSIVTPSDLHDMYFSSSRESLDGYFREASYGQASVSGDVFGPFKLDQDFDYATQQPDGLFAAIRAADPVVDFTVYNHIVLVWPVPGVSGWGGLGELGCEHLSTPTKPDFIGTFVMLAVGTRLPYGISLAAHEAGHNLGLNHASSLDYAPLTLGPPGVDGVHQEYGDPFSVMGGGEGVGFPAHFNAQHKAQLGWLDSASMQNVETGGTFVLQPFENPTGLRALRVRRGTGDQWLWLEYRQPIGYDASLAGVGDQQFSGALIHYEDPALIQLEADPKFYTFLLDFTPNTPHVFSDAALAAGQAWSDPYSSLTIAITSAGPAGLTVTVTYTPPCATLSPTSHNHGPGAETGTFTVTAPATCSWTATSTASWINITGGQSGTGSGTVSYSVAANPIPTLIGTPTVRTGSILAGFQTFTVTQASTLTNQPPSLDWVSPNSGSGNSQTFTFSASDPRGAANLGLIEADFVRIDSNHNILFACQVTYVINSFTEGNGVSVSAGSLYFLTDDQKTFTGPYTVGVDYFALENSECGLDLSGVAVTSSGNSVQMAFPWVFFTAGKWLIEVTLVDNARNGVGGIEGSWTVPETTCTYSIGPASASVGNSETAGTIAVAAGSGCPWVARSSARWIIVTSALSGADAGAVSYAIAANTTSAARTGTITIAGKTFAITQSAAAAGTAPTISSAGIVNAASNRPGVASATWISIYGANLATATQTWSASDFVGNLLPAQLGGVSVSIGGQPAYVYYVSPTQINVLAPDYLAETVSVEVDTPAGRSNAITVQRNEFSPGLFLFSQGGAKYVAAVHADSAYVAPAGLIPGVTSRPASPGEIISLFGTGFGATDPTSPSAELVSQPAALIAPAAVRIGGAAAKTSFAGLVSPGLYQFNVTVPDIADGDQLVAIEIGGLQSQDNTYIPVAR